MAGGRLGVLSRTFSPSKSVQGRLTLHVFFVFRLSRLRYQQIREAVLVNIHKILVLVMLFFHDITILTRT